MSATTERTAERPPDWQHRAVWSMDGRQPQNEYARLIAAAPALVEALRALVGPDGDLFSRAALERARAALAAVEGTDGRS